MGISGTYREAEPRMWPLVNQYPSLGPVSEVLVYLGCIWPHPEFHFTDQRCFFFFSIWQVNPQLKGHLKGALNGGATVEEVRAVRDVVIEICKASGMKRLGDGENGGWGWRSEVANL